MADEWFKTDGDDVTLTEHGCEEVERVVYASLAEKMAERAVEADWRARLKQVAADESDGRSLNTLTKMDTEVLELVAESALDAGLDGTDLTKIQLDADGVGGLENLSFDHPLLGGASDVDANAVAAVREESGGTDAGETNAGYVNGAATDEDDAPGPQTAGTFKDFQENGEEPGW
jgi:hypothetical protein